MKFRWRVFKANSNFTVLSKKYKKVCASQTDLLHVWGEQKARQLICKVFHGRQYKFLSCHPEGRQDILQISQVYFGISLS